MGTLTPGAKYVYENDGTRIYARELGKTERRMIGYAPGAEAREQRKILLNQLDDILTMCESDPAMKDLLDQLFVLYNLKKTHK